MASEADTEPKSEEPLVKVEVGALEVEQPASLPPITSEKALPKGGRQGRLDARRRILAAREDLERRVAEATEARLRRQAEAEESARRRAEQAQRRARKRLVERKKTEIEKGSPSAESGRSASPRGSHSPLDLPGLKSAKVRVKKKVLKQREEQEARLKEIEEGRAKVELRRRQDEEAAEVHRAQAARRAAERWRREKALEERLRAEREQGQREQRERQKLYRKPKDIARLIADAQELHTAEERRRAQQQEENFLQRERERARRQLDGELEEGRPFGAHRASKTADEDLLAKTVHALTDEEWKVNINFT